MEVSWSLDFRVYFKATVIKILWYLGENGHRDQRTRPKTSEINSHIRGQPVYDKGAKSMQ